VVCSPFPVLLLLPLLHLLFFPVTFLFSYFFSTLLTSKADFFLTLFFHLNLVLNKHFHIFFSSIIHRCIKKFRDLFHRPPTDGSTWMRALCLGAGNVATQHAVWRRCVNIGSYTTRVFVTTCAFTFAISAWTCNWSREQTSNSAWNSANLERIILKWYDVHMEMRPWVARGVSSGTRASREAEHHSKTTRGQGDLPRAQRLKMWKQFGGLCMRIVREPLRTLLQLLMCHTEQCRQFSHVIWTCTALLQSSCPGFWPPNKKSTVLQFVKSFVSVPWMTHPSSRGSSLGKRVGSMGMIPRLNNSLRNGRAQDPQDQRRRGRAAAWPRACSSCFSTFEGLCTMNLPPKARPWTPGSTAMFFAVWGRIFSENDLNCGARAIRCSMMTMHPLTELS